MSETKGESFSELEHAGWERAAEVYDGMIGAITSRAAEPLLDATGVESGTRVLELCCGPGYGSAAAAARGAHAVGVDFSASMIDCARNAVPKAQFDVGDAHTLPYDDASFDAVICPFGLLHLADPDLSIAEAFRVLRPGGRYGFTVWCGLDKNDFFALVFGSIKTHGTLDVPLPEAPPIFRFSETAEGAIALETAGFVEPTFRELPFSFRPRTPGDVLELTYKSAVRTPMVLELQTDEARERIHNAIVEGSKQYVKNGVLELAMPALMGTAQKPESPAV